MTPSPRPTPRPERPWIMQQRWERVLFLHWRVDAADLRARLPAGLDIQERDGSAWVSLLPMHIADMRLRWMVPVVHLTHFAEINLRTYVSHRGRPGVWFLRILAANRVGSWIGRNVFDTPYEDAAVRCEWDGDGVQAVGERGDSRLRVDYRPAGPPSAPPAGSLDEFLAERYALFARRRRGGLALGAVQHAPWQLQEVEYDLHDNTVLAAAGLPLPARPDRAFYAAATESHVWPLERIQ